MSKYQYRKGFTLLEILLVIALIGILAAIVLIAINPRRQITQAQNAQRAADIRALDSAISQYVIDNKGVLPPGLTNSYQSICPEGGGSNCVDWRPLLVPQYIDDLPIDPTTGLDYQVAINPNNNQLSVIPSSESDENLPGVIGINPFTPSVTFAKRAGSTADDGGKSVISLSDGSSISVGVFRGTATFGQGESNETSLISAGDNDIFITKYNADGTLAWARRAGGTGIDVVNDSLTIKSFTNGDFMIAGSFIGVSTFGPGEGGEVTLTSAGGADIYIARYNANGTLAWARRAGGTIAFNPASSDFVDAAYGLGVFGDGTSVITGTFDTSAIFGQGEVNQTTLSVVVNSRTNMFTAKYNADGTLAWARRTGNSVFNAVGPSLPHGGRSLHTYTDNSFVVAGYFTGTTTFGQGDPSPVVLSTGNTNFTIFIAKYNADGTLAWARQAGGSGYDNVSIVSGYSDGSSVITGWFTGSSTFGAGDPNATVLTAGGSGSDGYIAKYNPNGTLAWAKRFGGTGWDFAKGVATLADGSVLMNGFFQGTATIGVGDPSPTIMTAVGGYDIVTAKYNTDGSLAWARQVGSNLDDYSNSITSITNGESISTGEFRGTVTFGSGDTNQTILTSAGGADIYTVKYNVDGRLQ